jgi:DNA mismatch endonuclease Vsr
METFLRSKLPKRGFSGTPACRSAVMRSIKGKDNRTTERRLRFALVQAGIYGWIIRPSKVRGHPDFYFPDKRIAVFVDGCFWHGCHDCGHFPKTNSGFWRAKILRTRERDEAITVSLIAEGVGVVRFWEHDCARGLRECVQRITALVKPAKSLHSRFRQ